jgi:hypothetical protein
MKSIYYTGQALAIAIGVFVGVEHNSPSSAAKKQTKAAINLLKERLKELRNGRSK